MDEKCGLCGVKFSEHNGYFQSVLKSESILIPIFTLIGSQEEWDKVKKAIMETLPVEEVMICSNCLKLNY